jgi:hypothetical protein
MNSVVSRFTYRLLLRLHPAPFQHEFGAEMLWIFDEEYQRGASSYLLFDGVISLVRQRWKNQSKSGLLSIRSGEVISNPGVGPLRLLQAGVTTCAILFSIMLLSSRQSPLMVSVRWSERAPCYTITLQSPTHMAEIRKTMP